MYYWTINLLLSIPHYVLFSLDAANQQALIVVDGIGFLIHEASAGSHTTTMGIAYGTSWETCINRGEIVWMHGPFLCGSFPEL